MYRPHLVPLSFPLLGLRLKGVPLLLPAGMTVTRSTENLKKIGFKLNEAILFPGLIPRRFSKSDSEMLQTSSMSLYEDLTQLFFLCMIFGQ